MISETQNLNLTENGKMIIDKLEEHTKRCGCQFQSLIFDGVYISAINLYANKNYSIHIHNRFADIQKEMALIHELLHIEQQISGIPIRNYSKPDFPDYYNEIQGLVLDAPIHKQLTDYGYDLRLITERDYQLILQFYSKPNIKPELTYDFKFPVLAAELYYSHSKESYEKLMKQILQKDKQQHTNIFKINSLVTKFINSEIEFFECFGNILDILHGKS